MARRFVILAIRALCASGVATLSGVISILICTGSLETTGAGALAPLPILPSVLLYLVLDLWWPRSFWKHSGFVVPIVGLFGLLLYGSQQPLGGEGAEEICWIGAVVVLSAGVATYLFLILGPNWRKRA